jgi:O-antigen ligase
MDADINRHQRDVSEAVTLGADSGRVKRKLSRHTTLTEAYVALLLFMVVYCARPEDWIPGLSNAPLAKIAGILALIAFLLSIGQIRQRLSPEVIFLLLLTVQLFATVPMSPVWKGGAFQKTVDFAKVGLIVLVMVMAVNTANRLRQLLFIHATSVAAISAVAVWKGRMLSGRLNGVLNGNYSNPNDLALSLVISLPLCLYLLFLTKNALWRAAWALAMLVMVYAVFLTGSRAGFATLAISSAVCLWEFAVRGRRPYLVVCGVVVGIVLWVSSGAIVGQRLKGTFDSNEDVAASYSSSEQRQQLLWQSIKVTAQHPLFGVGPGNFQQISGNWHETHNSYTQMSSEGGIPALIFYLLILSYGFKNIRRTKQLSTRKKEFRLLAGALNASLAGFVVGSFFASDAYQFFPYFLVAYTTTLLRVATKCASESRKDEPFRKTAPGDLYATTIESKLSDDATESQVILHLPGYRGNPL